MKPPALQAPRPPRRELTIGGHATCTGGTVELFVAGRDSPKTSQKLADWYSLSHVVDGLLYYTFLSLVVRRWPAPWRFTIAVAIEGALEVPENTATMIDRYRETTAALESSGDSVLNSMSDIAMVLDFLLARKLPLWAAALVVLILEITPLFVIRDSLFLNIWNLIALNASVAVW